MGVILVILVAIIWVISAVAIQNIFEESNYNKPYFLTYFSTSLFTLYFINFLSSSWRRRIYAPPSTAYRVLPSTSESYYHELSSSSPNVYGAPIEDLPENSSSETSSNIQIQFNVRETLYLAMFLAPMFFLANLTFNIGLDWTSVSSSSTISTLTSLFALVIGVASHNERFSRIKLLSSIITIIGVALITINDERNSKTGTLKGDMISVLSSFIFALYTVSLKQRGGDAETVSMAMMLAFLGAFVFITGWPFLILLHFMGWEKFELPSRNALGLLIANGLIGTVLSDLLWMKSVQFTTPVIATLSLALSVPLSFFSDIIIQGIQFSVPYIIGAILVCGGFTLVNIDELLYSQLERFREIHEGFNEPISDVSSSDDP